MLLYRMTTSFWICKPIHCLLFLNYHFTIGFSKKDFSTNLHLDAWEGMEQRARTEI